jgi:undecaprenyl-diphosphatase
MRLIRDWHIWILPAVSLGLFLILAASLSGPAVTDADAELRAAVHSVSSPPLTSGAFAVSFLGSAPFLTVASVSAVGGLWLANWRRAAYAIGVVMIGEVALENGLKFAFARARPAVFFGTDPSSFSFPSGHALASLCFYGVVAILVAQRLSSPPARAAVWGASGVMIVLIGLSRVYIGLHYPSDVLGGYLIGLAWLGALRAVDLFPPPAGPETSPIMPIST